MDKVLWEDLKRQNKYKKYYRKWSEQNFKSLPNERELIKNLEVLSQSLGIKEGLLVTSFDYRSLELAFFAGEIEKITGVPESIFRKKGMEATLAILHPDDRTEMINFQNLLLDTFHQLSLKERYSFEFSYTTRFVHRITKVETWLVGKARPYLIDCEGNFAMDLHIIMQMINSPKIKSYDWNYTYTNDEGSKVIVSKYAPKNREVKLTKKERIIVKFMIDGLVSREISEKLNISINTVATHRKNILRKLGARNIGELVKILAPYDF